MAEVVQNWRTFWTIFNSAKEEDQTDIVLMLCCVQSKRTGQDTLTTSKAKSLGTRPLAGFLFPFQLVHLKKDKVKDSMPGFEPVAIIFFRTRSMCETQHIVLVQAYYEGTQGQPSMLRVVPYDFPY